MIIKRPLITESAITQQASGKFMFYVEKTATKDQIKSAFFAIFKVKPTSVNTLTSHGKISTNRRTGKKHPQSSLKKAIVSVPKDSKIELLNFAKSTK